MRIHRTFVSLAAVASIGLSLAACSDGGSAGTGGTAGNSSSSSSSSSGTTSSTGGTGGAAPAAPSFVAHLDPAKGELAEGLFVTGSKAYVGLAALGKIITVDLPGGTVSDFASIPTPPMNGGFMLGIVVDASGNVYVGFGGGPGMVVKNGVYKIPAAGGAVTDPWATDAEMNFPNGLVFDDKGNLFVADSGGAIFKIASDGTVTKWLADPTLSAAGASCMFGAPFPIGANGIVLDKGVFYVSNTNVGQIVSIPVKPDGSAGTPAILAGPDCNALGGIDGIASDGKGGLYGVINSQSQLVHLAAGSAKVEVTYMGMPLDNPASIVVGTVGGKTSAFVTNSAFFDMMTPAPGLLSYPLP
jgi:sugar lactone lactonase YvrE